MYPRKTLILSHFIDKIINGEVDLAIKYAIKLIPDEDAELIQKIISDKFNGTPSILMDDKK